MNKFNVALITFILVAFGGYLFIRLAVSPESRPTTSPFPVPTAPAGQIQDFTSVWITSSWQGHSFKYPPGWQVEIFNDKNGRPISLLLRPQGALGEDRIFIGTFPVGGGQFFSECYDVLAASPSATCQVVKGLLAATASANQGIKQIYSLIIQTIN
jgi:hypothetical protein